MPGVNHLKKVRTTAHLTLHIPRLEGIKWKINAHTIQMMILGWIVLGSWKARRARNKSQSEAYIDGCSRGRHRNALTFVAPRRAYRKKNRIYIGEFRRDWAGVDGGKKLLIEQAECCSRLLKAQTVKYLWWLHTASSECMSLPIPDSSCSFHIWTSILFS